MWQFACISLYMMLCFTQETIAESSNLTLIVIQSYSIEITWSPYNASLVYGVTVVKETSIVNTDLHCYNVTNLPFKIIMSSNETSLSARTSYNITLYESCSNTSSSGILDTLYGISTAPEPPQNVTSFSLFSTQLLVNWNDADENAEDPVVAYSVCYRPVCNDTYRLNDSSQTNLTIIDLASNTKYDIRVRSLTNNSIKFSNFSQPIAAVTIPKKANTPTISSESSTNSVPLQWDEVNEGSVNRTYIVDWMPQSSSGTYNETGIVTNSIIIDGLASNTEYNFTVRAVNVGGAGERSNSSLLVTLPEKANTPTISSEPSTNSVPLQWDEVDEGPINRTYIVDWMPLLSSGTYNKTGIVTNSVVIDSLSSNTEYNFTVRAVNVGGAGERSNSSLLVTLPEKANTPTISSEPSTNSVPLQWDEVNEGPVNRTYIVDWMSQLSSFIYNKSGIVTNSIVIDGLSSNTEYNFTVRAVNVGGAGEISNSSLLVTLPEKANTPTISSEPSTNSVPLQWNEVDEGHVNRTYTVDWMPRSSSGSYNKTGIVTNSIVIDGLSSNTEYNFTVRAVNVGGAGERSNSSLLVTLPARVKSLSLRTSRVNSTTSIDVMWTKPDGGDAIDMYLVRWKSRDSSDMESVAHIFLQTVHKYTIAGLKPGRSYDVTVTAENSAGESLPVTKSIATELDIRPSELGSASKYDYTALLVGILVPVLFAICAISGIFLYRRSRKSAKSPVTSDINFNTSFSDDLTLDIVIGEVKSKMIQLSEFNQHMHSMIADGSIEFSKEYQELREVGRQQSVEVSQSPSNRGKNRYTNILSYDASRVKLTIVSGDPTSDYINANYIQGNNRLQEYIATQGPLPGTKDDFWRLVWEQNSRNIVMVTQTVELGKIKCEHYWPFDQEPIAVGKLLLKMTSEDMRSDFAVRKFILSQGSENRVIIQFHFTAWPDHGVPMETESLVRFVRHVRCKVDCEEYVGPTVVHCSAGVGRTGTFIAMDRLLQHLQTNSYVDIFGIVHEMRMNRMFMVQSESQYIFIHKMVQDLINRAYVIDFEVGNPEQYHSYANITQSDPVYENVDFHSTKTGVVNQSMIETSSDDEI